MPGSETLPPGSVIELSGQQERGINVLNIVIDDKERAFSYIPDFAEVYVK